MQKELQLALLVIGGIFIIGILVHGFWITRKQRSKDMQFRFESRRNFEPKLNNSVSDDNEVDELGPVRVINNDAYRDVSVPNIAKQAPTDDVTASASPVGQDARPTIVDDQKFGGAEKNRQASPMVAEQAPVNVQDNQTQKEHNVLDVNPDENAPLYADVVTQPKPEFIKEKEAEVRPPSEPPAFLLKQSDDDTSKSDEADKQDNNTSNTDGSTSAEHEKPSAGAAGELVLDQVEMEKPNTLANQARKLVRRKGKSLAEKLRREPVVSKADAPDDDQMRMDFGESKKVGSRQKTSKPSSTASNTGSAPEQDVIVLNIQTASEAPIQGAMLLQTLLTLGFKFGDHDIFHRHVNTNGKGPVLFSLANLFKPGVFDIDNIEKFTTQGLSLFMMLPIEGEAQQVFNMMHNAARKIADEYGCKILDANKVPISKQSLQQYAERIRDFERRQKSR